MGDSVAKGVLWLLILIFKPLIFLITWTYLWVPFAGIMVCGLLIGYLGFPSWTAAIVIPISLFAWLWFFVQRLVRIFKRDPEFSFFALIVGR